MTFFKKLCGCNTPFPHTLFFPQKNNKHATCIPPCGSFPWQPSDVVNIAKNYETLPPFEGQVLFPWLNFPAWSCIDTAISRDDKHLCPHKLWSAYYKKNIIPMEYRWLREARRVSYLIFGVLPLWLAWRQLNLKITCKTFCMHIYIIHQKYNLDYWSLYQIGLYRVLYFWERVNSLHFHKSNPITIFSLVF